MLIALWNEMLHACQRMRKTEDIRALTTADAIHVPWPDIASMGVCPSFLLYRKPSLTPYSDMAFVDVCLVPSLRITAERD